MVYSQEDHLGLRQLVRFHGDEPLSFENTGPGSWWRLLKELRTSNEKVNVVSDRVKIRSLRPSSRSP